MLKRIFLTFAFSSLFSTSYVLASNILELEGGSQYNCENGAVKHSGDPKMAQHMEENVWYSPFEFYKSIIEAGGSKTVAKQMTDSFQEAYAPYCNK
tara:strand:+ start:259 stop:546 length:288 start_codon:yes stop_codon:yes gene_type:complete